LSNYYFLHLSLVIKFENLATDYDIYHAICKTYTPGRFSAGVYHWLI